MKLFRQIVLALALASLICILTYTAVSQYVVQKAEENLRSIMLSHRGFHAYIQRVMHPTYYKARDKGMIDQNFYAPEILSSSYITRVMHDFFNEARVKEGLPPVYYKLASNNPRNPVSRADEQEEALIRLFNSNRSLKEYSKVVTVNGHRQLIYAKPFLETNQPCLRCHGKREDAPSGLQALYQGEGGFNEKAGVIRAIESIRIPIDDDLLAALVAASFSLSAVIILALLYLFNQNLRQKVREGTEALQGEIEERKAIQEALATSEENYRQFTALTSDYVHRCSRKLGAPYRIEWIGGALGSISGYDIEEMYQLGCWMPLVHPADRESTAAELESLRPGETRELTFRIIAKDQSVRWISDTCRCELGSCQDELIVYGAASDVTERVLAEEMLQLTRVTVNAVSDAIFWAAPDGRVVDVNEAACLKLGYTREELLGMTIPEIDPGESLEELQQQFQELRQVGTVCFESTHRAKDGRLIPVEVSVNYVRHGDVERNCGIARDISERKAMEEALRQSEESFRSIVESSPLAMHFYQLAASGELVFNGGNPSADRMFRISHGDLIGKTLEEAFPLLAASDFSELCRKVAKGELGQQSFERSFDDNLIRGTYSVQMYRSSPAMLVVDFMDITERKRGEEERLNLEKQLLHAQKLESLGVLAGGIAHDFNNLLTSIMGHTDLALLRLNRESPVRENLHQVELAATRAADLAKQMLAYSGRGKFLVEPIDLNRLVEEMTKMLEISISKRCVLRFNLAARIPMIDADATQLRQIIMNLVINASEAIGEKSGVIAVSTGCMQCDRRYLNSFWLNEQIPEGLYIWFEIADTGCGMDKETVAKIFDPFFTTKFTGRGLGMAAVLGIVRGHKGAIKVYSEVGQGTSFKVLLPAGERVKEFLEAYGDNEDGWKGKGTVLLVDDEETVIGIGSEMLKELGFEVLTALDGREGLELFKQQKERIVAVLLDLTMPHLDGEQTFRELRLLDPEVKVIMSSGYNEQEVTQRFAGKGLAGFIQKPYKLSTLKGVISGLFQN
ncbi:Sensory box histidine kinase/response regulator [Citrifermentans bremense]|uniref:histidine kinase n=1 Tax=Citrifermentans bremense TaxID=60035 RepID=A0A6S6M2Y6_9BACT|nr:PAS domain S-box protein [Citrifermentans bremense]BCG47980.1 Sensory box histidine kinase/response regulator [Citrifermentans bremense]